MPDPEVSFTINSFIFASNDDVNVILSTIYSELNSVVKIFIKIMLIYK